MLAGITDLMWVKTGVTKDGAITGMHFRSLLDGERNRSYGVASTYTACTSEERSTYPIPRYKGSPGTAARQAAVRSRTRSRHASPRFALEVHLDKMAEQLNVDPAELRLNRLQPPNSLTGRSARRLDPDLGECPEGGRGFS